MRSPWRLSTGATDSEIARAGDAANARLPDYARVGDFVVADEPFTLVNGQLTATGRPRRDTIFACYAAALAARNRKAM